MPNNVDVIYNGNTLTPAPFVSRTETPLDYGKRWGFEDVITLKGMYLVTPDSGVVNTLVNLFTGQFSRLQVNNTTNATVLLDYPYTVLEEISFDSSHFYANTYTPYTVRLRAINVPSGVTDPANEYSFSQNEDGTVNVSHKVSAKGVVTSAAYDSAIQNAKTFVKQFTGVTPFSPAFVSIGSGVLLNQAETLDRLSATYSISETFKYNSGENLNYVYNYGLDIDQSLDADYTTLSFNYSRQGSSVTSNIGALRTGITGFNVFSFLQTKYGLDTGHLILNSLNVSEESGKNSIQVSSNLISGAGDEFLGFFDYDIDMKWDKITDVRQFTINGKFSSKAPVSQKRVYLQTFKNSVLVNSLSYQNYLYNIVTGSFLNSGYCSISPPRIINPIPSNFSLNENTGLADLSMTASFGDKDFLNSISDSSFTINVEAPRNLYEFKPSANIEGNYVIQDLQSLSREVIKVSTSLRTTGDILNGFNSGVAVEAQLTGKLLSTGYFLTESGFNTGIFDTESNTSYLNSGSKFGLDVRHYYSQNPKSLRQAGYSWGL